MIKLPFQIGDLRDGIPEDSIKHTIETHWFLFNESPTNNTLFPFSFSNNALALNLQFHNINTYIKIQETQRKSKIFFLKFEFSTLEDHNHKVAISNVEILSLFFQTYDKQNHQS